MRAVFSRKNIYYFNMDVKIIKYSRLINCTQSCLFVRYGEKYIQCSCSGIFVSATGMSQRQMHSAKGTVCTSPYPQEESRRMHAYSSSIEGCALLRYGCQYGEAFSVEG